MNNGCKYRGLCEKVLCEIESNDVIKNPFLSKLFFYVNFGQNFGPCSLEQPRCKVYGINKGIEKELKRIRAKNKKNHSIMLENSLMRI